MKEGEEGVEPVGCDLKRDRGAKIFGKKEEGNEIGGRDKQKHFVSGRRWCKRESFQPAYKREREMIKRFLF